MKVDGRIPVIVLGGFLGSGKTTLMNRLLAGEQTAKTVVIINEFGEIGLDHLLVRNVVGSSVVLRNGCVCCVIRSDLRSALHEIVTRYQGTAGFIFDRVIIETTGLADPGPIAQTIASDHMLAAQLRLGGIVCTADVLHGVHQIDTHAECLQQIAAADHLVVTKTDLASRQEIDAFVERLRTINPLAQWSMGTEGLTKIVADLAASGAPRRLLPNCLPAGLPTGHEGIRSMAVETRSPVDWAAFSVWLSAFIHHYADRVLRIKGLLAIEGSDTPVAFHVVRNHIHPPVHLADWPEGTDVATRIVFITKNIDVVALKRSFVGFLGLEGGEAASAALPIGKAVDPLPA